MTRAEQIAIIRKEIPEHALYDQLAEECCELAKECLKMARIIRGDNPTPRTKEEVATNLTEEFSDILLCADVVGLTPDEGIIKHKFERWCNRIGEANV